MNNLNTTTELELLGFDYDSSENKFLREGFNEVYTGIQIQMEGIAVSVCGCSDEFFETIAIFDTLEETLDYIKSEGL